MDISEDLPSLLDRKSKRYSVMSQNGQHLLLEDRNSGGTAMSGKLVDKSSEEFRHRPWLHQRNLAALLDMITINDNFTVFVTDYQRICLRQLTHEEEFVNSSECFALKKSFTEDVLCGLEYLHRNNLCLMNLSDAKVFICQQQNKAVITDFGNLSEKDNSNGRFSVPFIHQPPEVRRQYGGQFDLTEVRRKDGGQFDLPEIGRNGGEKYDIEAAEMWTVGMMVLEVFTQHKLPWALVEYDPDRVLEMVDKVEQVILKTANCGSAISDNDLSEFKEFVRLFIDENPRNRSSAKNAILAKFLQSSKNKLPSSPQKSLRKINVNNKSANSPKFLADKNNNNSSMRFRDKFQFPQNSTAKSISNMSLKNFSHPLKPNKYSDLQSNYECGNNRCFETINQQHEKDSKSKSMSNIYMSSSQEEENSSKDFNCSPNSQSKTSVSSQTDRPSCIPDNCVFERKLNSGMPASVYVDEILNKLSLPVGSHNYSQNSTRELPSKAEINDENKNNLRKNLSSKNEIIQESEAKTYASPITDSLRNILKATSSLISTPSQSSSNNVTNDQKPDDQKDLKSTDDIKDSSKKIFRIPASKYQPAEELKLQCLRNKEAVFQEIAKSKLGTKTAGKSLFTLPNTGISDSKNAQLMIKNNSESSLNGIEKSVKESNFQEDNSKFYKEVDYQNKEFTQVKIQDYDNYRIQNDQSTAHDITGSTGIGITKNMEHFNLHEPKQETTDDFKVKDLNKRLIFNIKTQNISKLKLPSSPTIDAMNLAWRNVPKNANENRNCDFRHGSKCPINQKAHIPQSNTANIQDGVNKENVSANNCQTCGNKLNEKPFIPRRFFEFPRGSPLPHGYWLSTPTRRAKKPQILSPSLVSGHLTHDPKKVGSGTHKGVLDVSSSVPNGSEEKIKNNVFSTAKHMSVSSPSIPNGNAQEEARQSNGFSTNNQAPDVPLDLPEENFRNEGFYDAPPPLPDWEKYVTIKHFPDSWLKTSDFPPPIPNCNIEIMNNQAPDVPPELPNWPKENCRNEGFYDAPPPLPDCEKYITPKLLMPDIRPKTSDFPPPIPNWKNERTNNDISAQKQISGIANPVSKWNDGEKRSNTDFLTQKRSSVTPPVQNLNKQEVNQTNNGVTAYNQVSDTTTAKPTWNVQEEKRLNNNEVKTSGEVTVHCKQHNAPRIIVVRGYTGRNTIRVETKHTKCVKKCCDPENHKKTSAKNDEVPNTFQEFKIIQDSSGNKKQSKKKSAFKKCFCIGK